LTSSTTSSSIFLEKSGRLVVVFSRIIVKFWANLEHEISVVSNEHLLVIGTFLNIAIWIGKAKNIIKLMNN